MTEEDAIALLIRSGCSPRVIEHCRTVARYAGDIALNIRRCSELRGSPGNIDVNLVYLGGLLHDIGRSKTHGIGHAVAGAEIALKSGVDIGLVNIIERHIGAGITMREAVELGLPEKDYLPVTLEEKIVAHADNLTAGSRVVTLDEQVSKLKKKNVDEKIIRRIIELNDEISVQIC